jgi:hypothetical protein
MTLRMAMSPITGAEIVVTRRRMADMRMNHTPTLFKQATLAGVAQRNARWVDAPMKCASHEYA